MRQRGECVRLDVIDTGIGIPADKQAEIFEEFRQLNNPARDSSHGLGLGLAIVSRLARLIGAEVQVASGSTTARAFRCFFRLTSDAAGRAGRAGGLKTPAAASLIIEDNSGIRQAYEIMLEDWGYETLSAATGEEALDRAAQANWGFDAIVADHRLGSGLTGNAAAKEIGRRAGRVYPTLLVTGDTAGGTAHRSHVQRFCPIAQAGRGRRPAPNIGVIVANGPFSGCPMTKRNQRLLSEIQPEFFRPELLRPQSDAFLSSRDRRGLLESIGYAWFVRPTENFAAHLQANLKSVGLAARAVLDTFSKVIVSHDGSVI